MEWAHSLSKKTPLDLTRLNKIAIQARAQMAADKEAVGLSRVHMYERTLDLDMMPPTNEALEQHVK